MSEIPYPCKGGPGGSCKSLCCFQAREVLHTILDMKLGGHPVDPAILAFPYTVDEATGRCEKLSDDDSFCTVYLDRPILCNLKKAAEALDLDPEIFLSVSAKACNKFMTAAGVPKEEQIDIEKYRSELATERVNITDEQRQPPE